MNSVFLQQIYYSIDIYLTLILKYGSTYIVGTQYVYLKNKVIIIVLLHYSKYLVQYQTNIK